MNEIDKTLTERHKTHGEFKNQAWTSQALKRLLHVSPNWGDLTPSQKETLEMIQHKISRILHGNPNFIDSWRDIIGYTQLVMDQLDSQEDATDVETVRKVFKGGQWVYIKPNEKSE